MRTFDHLRGNTLVSPLEAFRKLSPAERGAATEQYHEGFSINPYD